jgi:hypothetical protein
VDGEEGKVPGSAEGTEASVMAGATIASEELK